MRSNGFAIRLSLLTAILVGVLACASVASAQDDPVCDGYGGGGCVGAVHVAGTSSDGDVNAAGPSDSSNAPTGSGANISGARLPFTGFDLLLVALGGALLLGMGLAARWLSAPITPRL